MSRLRPFLALSCLAAAIGCGGGPWGHSRFYDPSGDEEEALEGAVEYDPVMVNRNPDDWAKKKITLFGIVQDRVDLEGGEMELLLSVRGLEGRNLCADRTEDSCRTTVSERENAKVRVRVDAAVPEDQQGEMSIGVGSLVRAIGRLETEGGDAAFPTIISTFYRHWPRGYFVTTASAKLMRQ